MTVADQDNRREIAEWELTRSHLQELYLIITDSSEAVHIGTDIDVVP